MLNKSNKSTFIVATLLGIFANSVSAANLSNGNMYQFGSNELVGTSTLLRSPNGVSFSVETFGPGDGSSLNGHMTTVWLVVFNEPSKCTPDETDPMVPKCGLDDVMNAMNGGVNESEIDVLFGAGNITGNGSHAHFAGFKKVGDLDKSTFNIGLKDAYKSEVHLVVRSHGPIVAGYGDSRGNVAESIGSFIGGCHGIPWYSDLGVIPTIEGQCNDIFFAIHMPK